MSRSELREELARLILHEEMGLTGAEVAEQAGLDLELVERLWRSLGFADSGDAPAYGDHDVAAARLAAAALEEGVLEERTIFRMTRALGQTLARLADWEVQTIVDQVEADVEAGRAGSRLESAVGIAQHVAPGFDRLLLYAWHRHLAAAAARLEALGALDAELLSTTMSIGFADLSRFTAMTNTLSDVRLGELVENFENRCTDVVTSRDGRVIKALGDAVLFVNPDPREATLTALELVANIGSRDDLPDVRVGLATGSAISRLGDVFGPPVNLAARLSHVARSNRVLVDHTTAEQLTDEEFEMRTLPPRPLRGFGNVSPITVSRRRAFRPRTVRRW